MAVPGSDRIFQWVQVVLSKEGVAANVKQLKYNFILCTLD
jgi:hypothetical protein